MAITKQYLKSKPECKVTFNVPAKEASSVAVSGDFNDWKKTELKKLKNGTFKGQLNLPVERAYEFRYLVDGEWINETEADRFNWNDFAAAENSVLEV
ncbi:isoamylase early set domain-containing protein [Salegentibacter sp. F188]|uniref:Isoamylase early set domain-containing protein n=1 Tax=Autumnicola patrickiae TaxID=3075591 RepID=A0ABU3DZN1_9FLAO|nr:isoamylase early set domain-containing protein [Salegentibacter sp. F188]MDT0689194.1 isoamylase early set domain-containing protein [Salegentibacter sp. F188]